MVPTFEKFLYPFLNAIREKDLSKKEMVEEIRLVFNLSDEDMAVRTKSGAVTQVSDRVGWSLQYLRRALFVENKDGKYHITQRGLDFLNTHKDLTIADLLEYEEFAAYSNRKKPKQTDEPQKEVLAEQEQTPTDLLEQAFDSIENDLVEDLLDKVLHQSPAFFERLVVDLLGRMGYGSSFEDSAEVTPYSHDGGIDGIIKEDKLGLDKVYIQAKRYNKTNNVQKPDIQKFVGALDENNADKGVFITSSDFTEGVRKYVEKSSKKIVLINGLTLVNYMIEYNVGVSIKKEYIVKRIDNDYFEE